MKKMLVLVLCLALVCTTMAFAEGEEVYKVGIIGPMTGGSANLCEKINWGIQMATDEFNENGGIQSKGGVKIELVFGDSTGATDIGATEAERLIVQEGCSAILTSTQSNVSASVAPICEKYAVPCILVTSVSNNILQAGYKYVFRFNHYGSLDARVCSGFVNSMGIKSVAIVVEDTDWGNGLAENITPMLDEYGIEIKLSENYAANATDFSSIVNKIKAAEPESIIIACYTNDGSLFAQTLREYNCNVPITAAAGVFTTQEMIDLAGDAVEYVCDINNFPAGLIHKNSETERLNELYKTYSGGMDLDQFPVCGWLSMETLFSALENAASLSNDDVCAALLAVDLDTDAYAMTLSPYDGIKTGEIDGMTNQNIEAGSTVCQVQDGKTVIVYPEALAEGEVVWPVPSYADR